MKRKLIGVFLLFSSLVYVIAWSPLLTVRSIEVTGLPTAIKPEFITSEISLEEGERLGRLDPRAIEKSLQEIPWILSADISRDWLSRKVRIAVTVRTPIAAYRGKAIDSKGHPFIIPGEAIKGLPEVRASTSENLTSALAIYSQLPTSYKGDLIELIATKENAVTSLHALSQGRALRIIWGDSKDVALKITVLQALRALDENKDVKKIDLSAPHAPIVK